MTVQNDMTKNEDPLAELLISESELNRGKLLEVLKDFIRIDIETGHIIPISDYAYLNVWQRILITLLGAKALKALGKREKETLGPKELSDISGINNNSVRSYLSQLETKKMIMKLSSEYYVPNYNLEKIRIELMSVKKNDEEIPAENKVELNGI
jgi:hypothetical protein